MGKQCTGYLEYMPHRPSHAPCLGHYLLVLYSKMLATGVCTEVTTSQVKSTYYIRYRRSGSLYAAAFFPFPSLPSPSLGRASAQLYPVGRSRHHHYHHYRKVHFYYTTTLSGTNAPFWHTVSRPLLTSTHPSPSPSPLLPQSGGTDSFRPFFYSFIFIF